MTILFTVFYLGIFAVDFYVQRWRLFLETLLANPTRIIFLLALLCIILVVPFRYTCNVHGEDILVSLALIMLSVYAMYFGRGFRFVCTFVYNIHLILHYNITKMCLIYAIFLLGFSQSLFSAFLPFFLN